MMLEDVRIHTHQKPDPERSAYRGGPLGEGYLDGELEKLREYKAVSPRSVVIEMSEGYTVELEGVIWHEPSVMWTSSCGGGEYVHGTVHIDWESEKFITRKS